MRTSRSRAGRLAGSAVVLLLCLAAGAYAAGARVHVQRKLAVRGSVHIVLHAAALPEHGYYYAVAVLRPYRSFTRSSPPPCATSSNMQRTDYGYPDSAGQVRLALTAAPSRAHRWCRGGVYSGAIYAVPHAPACESSYPCRSEPYEPPSPCWDVNGHVLCGVVRRGPWRYPDPLPGPLAKGTRLIARFALRFPG